MRTYSDPSTMTINYPDNLVFSGDLNRTSITKNTTATHIELSFTINGYLYKDNLYFPPLENTIDFSMSDNLKLIYSRTVNTIFDTNESFNFTIKLYNNTSLLDTESLSIQSVILGKRRVFDKSGLIKNLTSFDYDKSISLTEFYYYFQYASDVHVKLLDGSVVSIDSFQYISEVSLESVTGGINYVYYIVNNFMLNPTFQYLSGENYWTNVIDFPSCSSVFEIDPTNKLKFTIPDVSCGDTMEVQYNGGSFTEGQNYVVYITVDSITNPSGEAYNITIDLGGNQVTFTPSIGVNTLTVTCGSTGILKLIGYMDANTGGFGTHGFSITNIIVKDLIQHKIYLNETCNGVGEKLKLRFLNRFGLWRYYYVIYKSENIGASSGISLWFSNGNFTELNNLYSEENKKYIQAITVYREGLSKEISNDIGDIIYTDKINLWDDVNSVWIPIKVTTNSINTIQKDNLFDVSLNLLLQSNNE